MSKSEVRRQKEFASSVIVNLLACTALEKHINLPSYQIVYVFV